MTSALAWLLVGLVVVGGLAAWGQVVRRLSRGVAPFQIELRREVPWGLVDLIFAVACYAFVSLLTISLLRASGRLPDATTLAELGETEQIWAMAANAVSGITSVLLIALYLMARLGVGRQALGFTAHRCGYDLSAGALMFLLMAPPVLLLQSILARHFPKSHPLIDILRSSSSSALFWTAVFAAVVVAPVVEEFLFRVLLQGSLEKLAERWRWSGTGAQRPRRSRSSLEAWCLSVPLSSLIFGLAHYEHGPAPISLTLFALGLGHLYFCTHRILPCIAMHAALNGWSMAILWLSLQEG